MLKCADILHGTLCKQWNLPVDALVVWFMGNFPFHSARFALKQLQFTCSISWRLHYNLCSDEICVSVSKDGARELRDVQDVGTAGNTKYNVRWIWHLWLKEATLMEAGWTSPFLQLNP